MFIGVKIIITRNPTETTDIESVFIGVKIIITRNPTEFTEIIIGVHP